MGWQSGSMDVWWRQAGYPVNCHLASSTGSATSSACNAAAVLQGGNRVEMRVLGRFGDHGHDKEHWQKALAELQRLERFPGGLRTLCGSEPV